MKPFRIYEQYDAKFVLKKIKGKILHFDTFTEAHNVIKKLWEKEAYNQYCIIYFDKNKLGYIISLNIPAEISYA